MARKLKFDRWLFLAMLALVCCSLVMVYSASAQVAVKQGDPPHVFLVKQAIWILLGGVFTALAMRFDYRHFKRPVVIWGLLALAGAALVLVLFGPEAKGGRRWIRVGDFGLQPSEFAKLAIIVFTAAVLERRMDRINEITYSLPPVVLAVGAAAGLIAIEPDYGGAAVLVAIAAVMLTTAGLRWRYVLGSAAAMVPVAVGVLLAEGYRYQRLLAFWDPESDPRGFGWQPLQSKIAVGAGGLLGVGITQGSQKGSYLPEPHNDFIYAVIAEEVGLIGSTAILACFAVITWRGLRTASRAPDAFGALLATGLTVLVAIQAFFNISVVLGLLPTKGIQLPLVSAGGSSMLATMIAVGILLNISQHASAEA